MVNLESVNFFLVYFRNGTMKIDVGFSMSPLGTVTEAVSAIIGIGWCFSLLSNIYIWSKQERVAAGGGNGRRLDQVEVRWSILRPRPVGSDWLATPTAGTPTMGHSPRLSVPHTRRRPARTILSQARPSRYELQTHPLAAVYYDHSR